MKCPSCKKAETRSWKGTTKVMGVEVFARGEKCLACDDITVAAGETKRLEKEAAKKIAVRGPRKGVEVKFLRKMAGLTAVELADLLGVASDTVSRWERDATDIPRASALAISLLFDSPKVTRERLERLAAAV